MQKKSEKAQKIMNKCDQFYRFDTVGETNLLSRHQCWPWPKFSWYFWQHSHLSWKIGNRFQVRNCKIRFFLFVSVLSQLPPIWQSSFHACNCIFVFVYLWLDECMIRVWSWSDRVWHLIDIAGATTRDHSLLSLHAIEYSHAYWPHGAVHKLCQQTKLLQACPHPLPFE